MRGEEGHMWKTVLRTVVAVQLQISHTSVVCVREHSDESKRLIDTGVSLLVRNINNCDLVLSLVAEKHHPMGGFLSRCVCVCVCVCVVCACGVCVCGVCVCGVCVCVCV